MCRWIAYTGKPIFLDRLVTQPAHSLVKQSLDSKLNITASGKLLTTNGDGFGIGWYGSHDDPGLFKDDLPAWHDENLKHICHQVKSHTFFAHIRATTTGDIQRTNCHPFSYKNWLFQHNDHVTQFESIRRELQLDIEPSLFPELKGTTDSETFFLLALTYGLTERPKEALQRMVKRVLKALRNNDPTGALNLSCALSDGKTLYTLRFSYNEEAMTQFYSTHSHCFGDFEGPDEKMPSESTVVVSEPLDKASEKWTEIPNNTFTTVVKNNVTIEPFLDESEADSV
ncbi:class II glutamine amidotransferase [Alteromonas pelagimontana]|uniref:Class II glutamine amidotransferase n=1 Tax=Alteromonas pelagimontana TaxID=1858656 RepID=A0A6M4MBN9_9ALTE|nr:class II glutamine amidotransferase [Alteromonas pelagimontana]QJR79955.1 class II glutamine amidotransferase [Alteromonas pelagimontana]